jgi:hypothetical protein
MLQGHGNYGFSGFGNEKKFRVQFFLSSTDDFYYGDLKKFVLSSIALSIFCVLVSRIHILTFEKL